MKKLLSLLLCAAMISPVAASAATAGNTEPPSAAVSSGEKIQIKNSKANPVSVNFEAKKGDQVTLYITINSRSKVAGLLSDLSFNTNYLDCIDYDLIYTGAFVNRISRGFIYYSILFGPEGTFMEQNTKVIAFNFLVRKDISSNSSYLTFTPLEYYDTNLYELDYSEIGYKVEKTIISDSNTDTSVNTDTDVNPNTDTATDTDSSVTQDTDISSDTDSTQNTDTAAETDTPGNTNTDTDITSPHTHTPVTDPAEPATCTHTGRTEGSHCSVCGETIVPQTVIPMKPHEYEHGRCKNCGKIDPSLRYGDVNNDGDINSLDTVEILRFSINISNLSELEAQIADVNNDGNIDNFDAVMILRYSIDLEKGTKIGDYYSAE